MAPAHKPNFLKRVQKNDFGNAPVEPRLPEQGWLREKGADYKALALKKMQAMRWMFFEQRVLARGQVEQAKLDSRKN